MAHFCRTLLHAGQPVFRANSFTYYTNQSLNELQFVEKIDEQKERRLARGHHGNEPWGWEESWQPFPKMLCLSVGLFCISSEPLCLK